MLDLSKSEIYSAMVTARISHGAVIASYNYNVGPPDSLLIAKLVCKKQKTMLYDISSYS